MSLFNDRAIGARAQMSVTSSGSPCSRSSAAARFPASSISASVNRIRAPLPGESDCYPDTGDPNGTRAVDLSTMGGTDKGRTRRQVEFGDRVRSRRQELGWSQEKLAL